MKKLLIIGNWKCNPSSQKEAQKLFNGIKKGVGGTKKAEVVICPPFVYLPLFSNKSKRGNLSLGAQDVFWEESGAFTSQISPKMLKDLKCNYVIIGHSEKRKLGETDETINKKIKAALQFKIKPILCIGENSKEKKEGRAFLVVEDQLKKGIKGVSNRMAKLLIVAYEPVWAIGTKKPCKSDDAMSMTIFIRKTLTKIYSRKTAKDIRILYGGSVNSKNGFLYIKEALMDGLLVGGASLDPKEFIKLIKSV
jgi:triosephosphate isomerase